MARFDYETMVQRALRTVVRDSLKSVEKAGLSGLHHFYITFQTDRSDVKISPQLFKKHPEEITIVLQHQFWDLKVTDDYFSVVLSFNDVHENIHVPYGAIISFLDPSVKFGLQFAPEEPPAEIQDLEDVTAPKKPKKSPKESKNGDNVVALDAFRKK